MRRQPEKLTALKRREIVEKAIREDGWSENICARLMKATRVDRATLYRDKAIIVQRLSQEDKAGLDERRTLFLGDLRRLRDKATGKKAYAPAARLLDLEHRVLGLDRVPLPEAEGAEESGPVDTSLEAVLKDVRRMRRQAQAGHSYVAAAELLERERQLVESIRQRDEAKLKAEHAHLSEDDLVAMIEAVAASLPDAVKRRLRIALGGS